MRNACVGHISAVFTRFESRYRPTKRPVVCLKLEPLRPQAGCSVMAGHSAAQVLLKWSLQLGVPTQFRSIQPAHMRENMAVLAMPDLDQKAEAS